MENRDAPSSCKPLCALAGHACVPFIGLGESHEQPALRAGTQTTIDASSSRSPGTDRRS